MSNGAKPKPRKRRDPLLDAADLLDAGRLTHEQIAAMTSPEAKAEAYQQDVALPTMAAVGLGAAQGASFGLGDLAQKLTLTPTEQAALTATHAEHPYAWAAGRLGGAAIPFALTAGGATLPGVGARATQGLLGTAQGAGLTPGGPTERAVGAGAGGLLAAFAPELLGAAKTVGGKVPIVGPLARRLGGVQEGFPAALKATSAASLQTAPPTAQELAVANALNLPVSQVQGKVGEAAVAARAAARPLVPSVAPAPDVLATPTYARRAAAAAVPDARIPANSYKELQRLLRSGVPKEQIKVNYWTRGGAAEQSVPPIPVAAGQPVGPVLAFVRGQPYEALSSALANPSTPTQVRTVILQELKRRGIVGAGLLDPMSAPSAGLLAP